MARVFSISDSTQALAVVAALRRLYDYPREGVHIGGGRHVDLSVVNGDGWTLRHRRLWRRIATGGFFYFCDGTHDRQLTDQEARARLTAAMRTLLDNRTAAAADDPVFDDPTNFDETEPT